MPLIIATCGNLVLGILNKLITSKNKTEITKKKPNISDPSYKYIRGIFNLLYYLINNIIKIIGNMKTNEMKKFNEYNYYWSKWIYW